MHRTATAAAKVAIQTLGFDRRPASGLPGSPSCALLVRAGPSGFFRNLVFSEDLRRLRANFSNAQLDLTCVGCTLEVLRLRWLSNSRVVDGCEPSYISPTFLLPICPLLVAIKWKASHFSSGALLLQPWLAGIGREQSSNSPLRLRSVGAKCQASGSHLNKRIVLPSIAGGRSVDYILWA
jgi:hypothetical protein